MENNLSRMENAEKEAPLRNAIAENEGRRMMGLPMVYQSNYIEESTGVGREVCVIDEGAAYWYPMAETDSLTDVLDSFAEHYDFALDPDDDNSNVTVKVRAEEYRDGEHVDTAYATLHAA